MTCPWCRLGTTTVEDVARLAAKNERDAVVRWLRGRIFASDRPATVDFIGWADAVERGDHLT